MASASRTAAFVAAASSGLGAIAGGFVARWLVGLRRAGTPFGVAYLTLAATDRRVLVYGRSPALGLLRGPLLATVRYPDLAAVRSGAAAPLAPGLLSMAVAGRGRLEFEVWHAGDLHTFVATVARNAGF
jgi:hypothetical protein